MCFYASDYLFWGPIFYPAIFHFTEQYNLAKKRCDLIFAQLHMHDFEL